jgi:hypothetical protein
VRHPANLAPVWTCGYVALAQSDGAMRGKASG